MLYRPFFLLDTPEVGGEPGVRRFSGKPGLVGEFRQLVLTGENPETTIIESISVDLEEHLVQPTCWADVRAVQNAGYASYGPVGEGTVVTVRIRGAVETVGGAVAVYEKRRR